MIKASSLNWRIGRVRRGLGLSPDLDDLRRTSTGQFYSLAAKSVASPTTAVAASFGFANAGQSGAGR
jgi:hypothetical protein